MKVTKDKTLPFILTLSAFTWLKYKISLGPELGKDWSSVLGAPLRSAELSLTVAVWMTSLSSTLGQQGIKAKGSFLTKGRWTCLPDQTVKDRPNSTTLLPFCATPACSVQGGALLTYSTDVSTRAHHPEPLYHQWAETGTVCVICFRYSCTTMRWKCSFPLLPV